MMAFNSMLPLFLLLFMQFIEMRIQKIKSFTIETEDFLSDLRKKLNVPEQGTAKLKSIFKSKSNRLSEDILNDKMNTLALNSLLQKSQIQVCCPKSLITWQQGHNVETAESSSNCSVSVPDPGTSG